MKLMHFLMGLNDAYMKIRSNVLFREPLPDVRNTYAIISSEESYKVVCDSGTSHRPSNVTRSSDSGNMRPNRDSTSGNNNNFQDNNRRISNNNTVASTSSGSFTDEKLSTLLNIVKDNFGHYKNVNANMADHGFVGYPFDYRVTLGFGSIAGGLDHINPVIRLPLKHGISRGPIPGIKPTQALTAIQTIADHSQKWHDGTSIRNVSSNSNTDGLATIVSKLDNLGRGMKNIKENVHAIQVGCQIYEGPHLDKECPLNEEVKQLEEVKYGEFGCSALFNKSNRAKFHVGPPGYYTRTDTRPPYKEKNQALKSL
nr:ribonuclease H-like domain-containing protein [Tanacetum cinerariifolium]